MGNKLKRIEDQRELRDAEIREINRITVLGEALGDLIDDLATSEAAADKRWLAIAKTDLQKGFMSLTRAVAKSDLF